MENYEKKYKEAIERASKLRVQNPFDTVSQMMEYLFPELKESEDEKIRKEIMDFIDTKTIDSDERRNRWFSYLEKYRPISFTSLEDTEVKMSLMQYISELNQDVVHLHPGIETCNEWIAWLENIPYTIDYEKREGFYLGYKAGLEKQAPKPKWSEEDDYNVHCCIAKAESDIAKNGYPGRNKELIDWLKSLKQRIGG